MGNLFHIFQIVTSIFAGVHQAEQDLGPSTGTSKKVQVMDKVITTAAQVASTLGVAPPIESLRVTVSTMIDSAVSLFHLFGLFKHASPKPGA